MRDFYSGNADFAQLLEPLLASLSSARQALSVEPGQPLKLIAAVSGGEDSVVLLDLLQRVAEREQLELMVAHFDHGLRPESADEAWFVKRLAERLELPCEVGQADRSTIAGNLEAWARQARYEFLEQLRIRHGFDLIVTAHHRLDQAETFLFRLITGRISLGAQGICAIDRQRRLVRPLIEVEKSAIEDYALGRQLSFVFDSSNADLSRTRNRIRHQVIPLLSRINPNLINSLLNAANRLDQDQLYLEQQAEEQYLQNADQPVFDWLPNLPDALRWRVLRMIAEKQLPGVGREIGYDGFQRVERSMKRTVVRQDPRFSMLELGRGVKCRLDKQSGINFFRWPEQRRSDESAGDISGAEHSFDEDAGSAGAADEALPAEAAMVLARSFSIPGDLTYQLEDRSRIKLTSRLFNRNEVDLPALLAKVRQGPGSCEEQATAIFDYSVIAKSELAVRSRLPGDRIAVWGRGTRKVKKVFQERQVLLTLRDCLPIVLCNGIVLWIPGVARSKFAPVTENTSLILQLIYSRILSI